MIFINMPQIMLDEYPELTKAVKKLLQDFVDGTLDNTEEIPKEVLDDIKNELLVLDFSKEGRLTDAIILKDPQLKGFSEIDVTENVSPTDFTIKMKGKRLSPEMIKRIDDIKKAMVK